MSFDNSHYWSLAEHIYMNGKNSIMDGSNADDDSLDAVELRSIHGMATSKLRKDTMFYDQMVSYNNDDPFYADGLIQDVFSGRSRYNGESRSVQASVIYNTVLTHVMYVYILGKLNDAVAKCDDGIDSAQMSNNRRRNVEANKAWDEVAAFIVGSLESSRSGGSEDFTDGVFLWNLANKRGLEFSRVNTEGFAIVNEQVLSYLFSGKGQIQHLSCTNLARTSRNIVNLLLIPFVQTMIKYALTNHFVDWKSGDTDIEVFEGEAYAKFLIPIYQKFDEIGAAYVIQRNMIRNLGPLVVDGPQDVADTYLAIASDLGIQCEFIGKSFEVNGCLNYEPTLEEVSLFFV